MLRRHIERLIHHALKQLQARDELLAIPAFVPIDEPHERSQGDFSTTIAVTLATMLDMKPNDVANRIVKYLPVSDYIEKITVAPSGTLYFYVSLYAFHAVIEQILGQKSQYGC